MVRQALGAALALLLPGCHLLAGLDGLELREDAEPLWSRSFGDEQTQVAQAVTAQGGDIYVVGELAGTLEFGDETLASTGESDLFVMALGPNAEPRWSRLLTGPSVERVRTVAVAGEQLVVAGSFRDELTAGAQTIGNPGEHFFVATLERADGTVNNAVSFGALNLLDTKLEAAVDLDGALVLVGGFAGQLDFGCGPPHLSHGPIDAFVVKLDAAGCLWSKHWGDGQLQAAESVGVDIGGNIVVAGEFSGTIAFDDGQSMTSGGGIDIFAAKLDPQGKLTWKKQFGDPNGLQSSVRVAVHPLGNVALAGFFQGTLDFGGGKMTSSRGHDLFVARFDPKGEHLWSKHYPLERTPCDPNDCDLDRIALVTDAKGDVIVAGHFAGSVDFGGTGLGSAGQTDLFVAKLDAADGSLLWSGRFGDDEAQCTSPDCLVAAAVDGQSNVLLAGYFDASIDFGLGLHESAGDHDAFVVKLGP